MTRPIGARRKARELALQMLFQSDLGGQPAEQVRATFWAQRENEDPQVQNFANDIFHVAGERHSEIDELIQRHAQHWRMERMSAVDRNVLRAGVAELLGFPQTPPPVVINEALEVARKY